MSKIKLKELKGIENLTDVSVKWSVKYGCPVFITKDGKKYIPMTGEWGGYYEEATDD